MRWYLDSSVALHAVLPDGNALARAWLDTAWKAGDKLYSSVLIHLELTRVLRRERLDLGLAQQVLSRLDLFSIDNGVVNYAAAIEPHVKSLDAIHLASCSLLGLGITIATHNGGMARAATKLGFATFDPLNP